MLSLRKEPVPRDSMTWRMADKAMTGISLSHGVLSYKAEMVAGRVKATGDGGRTPQRGRKSQELLWMGFWVTAVPSLSPAVKPCFWSWLHDRGKVT